MTAPTQANTREQLRAHQLDRLRELLAALVPGNRFYTPTLEAAGVGPDVESLDAFGDRTPFTTKAQLVDDQRRHPPFGTNLTEPVARYSRYHQTSGTTAAPLRWLDTERSWSALLDAWAEVYRAAQVTAADRVLFAFSFGPFIGFWMAFEAAARLGCLCLPGGGLRTAARLGMLVDNDATVVCCTPTYALRLGEAAKDEGVDLGASSVRRIIVAGEPGGSLPATRAAIETLWPGAAVIDHHGMTEVGPVSYSHADEPGVLRVIETAYFAEVIDPESLEPLGPGGTGELVLTTLLRTASPLLRYRTGDLVTWSEREADPDGRPFMGLDGGIAARVDDMVTVRGVNVYPSAVDEAVRACPGVAEYRVRVERRRGLEELLLEVEPLEGFDGAGLSEAVAAAMRRTLNLRVPVEPVEPGTLPRFDMKARRWVRQT